MAKESQALELALLVQGMRRAQKEYFRDRDNVRLKIAKDFEARVDRAVARVIDQNGLFGDGTDETPATRKPRNADPANG